MLLILVLLSAVVLMSLPSLSEGEEENGRYRYSLAGHPLRVWPAKLVDYRKHGKMNHHGGNVSWFLLVERNQISCVDFNTLLMYMYLDLGGLVLI